MVENVEFLPEVARICFARLRRDDAQRSLRKTRREIRGSALLRAKQEE
jgi:hypothetical protein